MEDLVHFTCSWRYKVAIKIESSPDKCFGWSNKFQEASCDGIALNLAELKFPCRSELQDMSCKNICSQWPSYDLSGSNQVSTKGIHCCIPRSSINQHLVGISIYTRWTFRSIPDRQSICNLLTVSHVSTDSTCVHRLILDGVSKNQATLNWLSQTSVNRGVNWVLIKSRSPVDRWLIKGWSTLKPWMRLVHVYIIHFGSLGLEQPNFILTYNSSCPITDLVILWLW